jgi:hypothetical protein
MRRSYCAWAMVSRSRSSLVAWVVSLFLRRLLERLISAISVDLWSGPSSSVYWLLGYEGCVTQLITVCEALLEIDQFYWGWGLCYWPLREAQGALPGSTTKRLRGTRHTRQVLLGNCPVYNVIGMWFVAVWGLWIQLSVLSVRYRMNMLLETWT